MKKTRKRFLRLPKSLAEWLVVGGMIAVILGAIFLAASADPFNSYIFWGSLGSVLTGAGSVWFGTRYS